MVGSLLVNTVSVNSLYSSSRAVVVVASSPSTAKVLMSLSVMGSSSSFLVGKMLMGHTKQVVEHCSEMNVTHPVSQLIVGLWCLNHGMLSTISCQMGATSIVICSSWVLILR